MFRLLHLAFLRKRPSTHPTQRDCPLANLHSLNISLLSRHGYVSGQRSIPMAQLRLLLFQVSPKYVGFTYSVFLTLNLPLQFFRYIS